MQRSTSGMRRGRQVPSAPLTYDYIYLLIYIIVWVNVGCSVALDSSATQCSNNTDCAWANTGDGEYTCVDSFCVPERASDPWGCIGEPPPASSTSTTSSVLTLHLMDLPTQRPLAGVETRLCGSDDTECEAPLSDILLSDDHGDVALAIDSHAAADFNSFVLLTAPALMPARYFLGRSLPQGGRMTVQLLNQADTGVLGDHMGIPFEPERGIVLLSVFDCHDKAGPGVALAGDQNDELTRQFYVVDGLPATTTAASATDRSGHAGFFNAKPGTLVVSARLETDQRELQAVGVRVMPGAVTYSRVGPHGK